jgi:hypothetical protein
MASIRCEFDLYRLGLDGQNWENAGQLTSGTMTSFRVRNRAASGVLTGQKRVYTDGVLTSTTSITLNPGDIVSTPGPMSNVDFASSCTGVSEADPANWNPTLVKLNYPGHSIMYQAVITGTM